MAVQARASAVAAGLVGGAGVGAGAEGGMGREVLRRVMGGQLRPPTAPGGLGGGGSGTLGPLGAGSRPIPTSRTSILPNTASTFTSNSDPTSPSAPTTGSTTLSGVSASAGGARARMGEWVQEMTGPTSRAPTEEEIGVLRSMFPNLSREVIVRALERR